MTSLEQTVTTRDYTIGTVGQMLRLNKPTLRWTTQGRNENDVRLATRLLTRWAKRWCHRRGHAFLGRVKVDEVDRMVENVNDGSFLPEAWNPYTYHREWFLVVSWRAIEMPEPEDIERLERWANTDLSVLRVPVFQELTARFAP